MQKGPIMPQETLMQFFGMKVMHISKSIVKKTIQRFEETVKDCPKSGRPASATNPKKSLDVLQFCGESPHFDSRSSLSTLDKPLVHKTLKHNKFHPFKVCLMHKLNEDDFDRRVEFCEMMTRIDTDLDFLFRIVFSDEAMFKLNDILNRHNNRY